MKLGIPATLQAFGHRAGPVAGRATALDARPGNLCAWRFWENRPEPGNGADQTTGGGSLPDSAIARRTSTRRSRTSPTTKKIMIETIAGRRLPVH